MLVFYVVSSWSTNKINFACVFYSCQFLFALLNAREPCLLDSNFFVRIKCQYLYEVKYMNHVTITLRKVFKLNKKTLNGNLPAIAFLNCLLFHLI